MVATPSGASVQQGWHYVQLIRNGGFRQFDYENKRVNRKIYGRDTPPEYDLTQIKTPVNLFYSKDDDTTVYENVVKLESQLTNVKSSYIIPMTEFTHLDFIYSRYVRNILNDQIINTIKNTKMKIIKPQKF